ncbi:MAG: asparaginase [Acidimicrobiales bacterium]|nr:MAG: asparaginase [Acidimicrobiales bacterium]
MDVVAVDDDGRILWSRGDAERAVLPRSALKPVQAVPLVRTGLLDADPLADRRLALACASHGGEPLHVQSVDAWLADLGLDQGQLACGAHVPTHRPSADALVAAGELPTAMHNNCSGKHVGFLAVCRHADIESAGYLSPTHPLQAQHLTPIVEELCGVSLSGMVPGVDGCGIPVWSLPLDRLAAGWAALARSDEGRRIYEAMTAEPFMVAGTDRACTRLMESGAGRLAVKTGAEGVYCAIATESGAAIALKARDGATRASEIAVEWAIAELGVGDPPEPQVLRNWAGTVVGEVRIAD